MSYSPTVRRRRLSAALRQFRIAAGLHADQVARRLEWTPSKVTRIERNEWKLPSVRDVRDLLDVYGVTDEAQREAILALTRQARQRGWWEEYKDVLGGAMPGFEAEASAILTYESLLVPGLLQTASYAAAVFRGGQVVMDDLIDRRVEARLARQQILDRVDPPTLWAVIDEAALAKHVGGVEVMREQIDHIITMARRPNIAVQVLPNAVGAHAAMENAFRILKFPTPEDPTLVHVETITGDLFMEETDQVSSYTLVYDHVRASALSADASAAYLEDLFRQMH
ncbi:helix-turn-helix domain-containing protein [Nonomuraea sp. NPDC049646]|uniref:helix-turn-helix domain-containing protein n=1 Tax=unclassified Nonomuraea TaxID=2593643 RepID=UPI0037A72F16